MKTAEQTEANRFRELKAKSRKLKAKTIIHDTTFLSVPLLRERILKNSCPFVSISGS